MTRLRFFGPDRRGSAAMEFAFLGPVMILLLFGLLELGYVGFARSTLESATMSGARYAAAQSCLAKRQPGMQSIINTRMSDFNSADGKPVVITSKAYGSNFGDAGNPEPFTDANSNKAYDVGESYDDVNGNGKWDNDMGRDGSVGGAGDVVTLTTSFKLRPLVPFLAEQINGGRDHYQIGSSTVVRNEPFFRNNCS